ncbi:MAG: hypothetical protein OEW49_04055 [Nitrosopumilus sp.]|nr:hypothetical protein [Nitrosopumilus sp.]
MTIEKKQMTSTHSKKKEISTVFVLMSLMVVSVFTMNYDYQAYAAEQDVVAPNLLTEEQLKCADKITESMNSQSKSIDGDRASSLTQNNPAFNSRTADYDRTFHSVYFTWNLDYENCTASLNDVNVGYILNDADGYVKNVVVTIDKNLSGVTDVSEHVGGQYGYTDTSGNWAAYEIGGSSFTSSTNPTKKVYEAKTSYTVPSVSQPSAGDCNSKPCNLAIWTGLVDTKGATNTHIAQAGTDQKIVCTPTCTTSQFFWYQFKTTSNAFQCSTTINSGNSILVTVTNQKKTGGLDTKYNVSMQNTSTGLGCSISNYTYSEMNAPVLGEFINERASYNPPTIAKLAKFTSDTMTGWVYYHTSSKNIYTPYSNGYYHKINMSNSGTSNISTGNINVGGYFTETWQSSTNT